MPIGPGEETSARCVFRSKCRPVFHTQNAASEGTEISRFLRVFLCQKVMKSRNSMNSKNYQNPRDFSHCAGLRWVISLSSICTRAWKLTKVPSATWRGRRNQRYLARSAAHRRNCRNRPASWTEKPKQTRQRVSGPTVATSASVPEGLSGISIRQMGTSETESSPVPGHIRHKATHRMGPPTKTPSHRAHGNSRKAPQSLFR